MKYIHSLLIRIIQQTKKAIAIAAASLAVSVNLNAAVTFEKEYKVADDALYFNGRKVGLNAPNNNTGVYDFKFGPNITAHGDAIKIHKEFIFTTWYRGGKSDRHMMLSRYNTKTGTLKTIEFPHRHTGLRGQWWIGESHNTIAVGISPRDGTIHLLFDMHAYKNSGAFKNDYFRYAYTVKNAATVADKDFKLNLFVKDKPGDYSHVSLNGRADPTQFERLTYPRFFLNDRGDLLMHMRRGSSNNGAYVFSKYNASSSQWDRLTQFNHFNVKNRGQRFNWGLYGSMKYVNGKLRTGFQVRSANNNDKFQYQHGIFYAYSNDQSGRSMWKDHTGKGFDIPFANPDIIKIFEPGNLVSTTAKNQVHIVGGFDWTMTKRGDLHFISRVKDNENNVTKHVHTYKPAGSSNFRTTTNFSGAESLYTYENDIYIITLKGGRPFIRKASGGTNNFMTVYEPNSGKIFSHGRQHIDNGKLYYYLQERGSSTKLPAYVQIIDLGLGAGTPPTSAGPEGYTFAANEGETVNISATMDVAYGAQTEFFYQFNQTDNLQCTNAVFGDPISGVAKSCYVKAVDTGPAPGDQCNTTAECKTAYPNFTGVYDCADSKSSTSVCMCGANRCDSLGNNSSSSSSSSSGGNTTFCKGQTDIETGDKIEINLNTTNCVKFSEDLSGKTLQVWDSDIQACNFRGTADSRDGSGNLNVTANYETSTSFTGRVVRFTPSNNCRFVKVRSF